MTLMTSGKEYEYWTMNNDELKLPDSMIAPWIATIHGIEALLDSYKQHFPELLTHKEPEDGT